jgi:hypothetical protein
MDTELIKKQLFERLIATLPLQGRRQNESKHRKFLIDCIELSGYIKKKSLNHSLRN